MKIRLLLSMILVIALMGCERHRSPFSKYKDVTKPTIFGKGTLSKDAVQWNNAFASVTQELYFTKMGESASVLYKMDYKSGDFKNLEKIPFPDGSPHSDIYINPEGNMMLFSSLMPEHGNDTITDWNIWRSDQIDGSWQNPEPFFESNLDGNQFYPWLTESGNLYFAITPHGSGNSDLYVSEYLDGTYQVPKALSGDINSEQLEGDAFVAPDESYIIFAGFERAENLGKSDLFISFNNNGNWSTPIWLGAEINSEGYDGSPFVTNDGNYLIFTSSRGSSDENTYFNHYIVRFNYDDWK